MMSVFHVNTNIRTSKSGEDYSTIHFAFATEQAENVEDLCKQLDAGRCIFGWRLVTNYRQGEGFIVKSKVATLLTRDGIAMIQDWTRGTLVEEEEA